MTNNDIHDSVDSLATDPDPPIPDYLTSPNAVSADEGVQWRYGNPPDYSNTRRVWKEEKKSTHVAGSLPELVENLVKNWEVEASFKPRLQDWRTIDHQNYTFAMNGGCPQSAEYMLDVGTYNAIIEPNEYYSPANSDFASSHKTFKRMMSTFAWEVLEVYSGPPKVAFKWRHWGVMKNDYVGFNDKGEKVTAKAHQGPIEIFGVTVAQVDEKIRLQAVETWMDPLAMFRQIAPQGIVNKEPMNRKVNRTDALDTGSDHIGIDAARELSESNGVAPGLHASDEVPIQHGSGEDLKVNGYLTTKPKTCPFAPQHVDAGQGPQLPEREPIDVRSTDVNQHEEGEDADMPGKSLDDEESLMPHSLTPAPTVAGAELTRHETPDAITTVESQSGMMNMDKLGVEVGETIAVTDVGDTQAGSTDITEDVVDNTENPTEPSAVGRVPDCNVSHVVEPSAAVDSSKQAVDTSEDGSLVNESPPHTEVETLDQYLANSADVGHPHRKDIEDKVLSEDGEAVAAPAESKGTQATHNEMSHTSSEECSFLMNRE